MMVMLPWLSSPVPSNDQDWLLEYAKLPQVEWKSQDVVVLRNIRNFRYYPTRDDYVPAWYDAEFAVSQLQTVDAVASYWSGKAIAHLLLSFGFQDGRHVAVSIETRRRRDQRYSPWRGFLKRYLLTYVLADERDVIGVRTDVRKERVYLYPLDILPETGQALFLDYLRRIHQLRHQPEFYHTLHNNCTSNILHHAAAVSAQVHYNWKVLMSGYADRYIYDLGLLGRDRPFEQLKSQCRIVRPDNGVITEDFSRVIRDVGISRRGGAG